MHGAANPMSRLRVQSFSISIDGFGAGPDQDLQHPLGVNGPELMEWFFHSRVWRSLHGQDGGETGVDNAAAAKGFDNIGAWILGRNMFGPMRGPWRRTRDLRINSPSLYRLSYRGMSRKL